MSESDKPSDLEEVLLSAVSEDFDVVQPVELPCSIGEAIQRRIDSADWQNADIGENENPDLQKTPTELYETLLKSGLHDAITALGLDSVIQKCKVKLDSAHMENLAKIEKKVTKWLVNAFSTKSIPDNKWVFFPDAMAIEGAANCSGSALIFGVIMNEEFGIQAEHVNPVGHAANLVTFSDGTIHYVDPRNQVNLKLKLDCSMQERDGFRIYDIEKSELEYRLLPVSELKHGATLTYLENLNALGSVKENDFEAKRIIDEYGDDIDLDFAREYMKGNFLAVREDEVEWQEEERYKQVVRNRRWFYFLIPNH